MNFLGLFSFLFSATLHLSTCIQQPMFINAVQSSYQLWNIQRGNMPGNPVMNNGAGVGSLETPLQKYKKQMLYHVGNLVEKEKGETIMNVLRTVIKVEKAGRLRLCFKYFGSDGCSKRRMIDPRPFFIWKKRITYKLTSDPTNDVLAAVRSGFH